MTMLNTLVNFNHHAPGVPHTLQDRFQTKGDVPRGWYHFDAEWDPAVDAASRTPLWNRLVRSQIIKALWTDQALTVDQDHELLLFEGMLGRSLLPLNTLERCTLSAWASRKNNPRAPR